MHKSIRLHYTSIFSDFLLKSSQGENGWVYFGANCRIRKRLQARLSQSNEIAYADLFDQTFYKFKQEYIDLMVSFSGRYCHEIGWWLSSFASRDNGCTKLYSRVVFVLMAEKLSIAHASLLIAVDDPVLYQSIKRNCSLDRAIFFNAFNYFIIRLTKTRLMIRNFIKSVYGFARLLIAYAVSLTIPKQFLSPDPRMKHIYIHSFVDPKCIDLEHHMFNDRYFPGLNEYLSAKHNVVHVIPTLHNFSVIQFRKVLAWMRSRSDQFLVPYDYIRLRHHIGGVVQLCRQLTFVNDKKITLGGLNVIDLIRHEKWSVATNYDLIYFYCLYAMFSVMKQKKLPLDVLICTYEQSFTDGLIALGVKENYPEARIIGFQHQLLTPDERFANYSSNEAELSNKICPDLLCVPNDFTIRQNLKNGLGKLKMRVVPALRYQYLLQHKKLDGFEKDTIVILGHMVMDSAVSLINQILSIYNQLVENYRLVVKLHPMMDPNALMANFSMDLTEYFDFTTEPMADVLKCALCVVYANTAAGVDAYLSGLHVFQFQQEGLINFSPLSAVDDPNYIHYIDNPEKFPEALLTMSRASNPSLRLDDFISSDFNAFDFDSVLA